MYYIKKIMKHITHDHTNFFYLEFNSDGRMFIIVEFRDYKSILCVINENYSILYMSIYVKSLRKASPH